MRHVAKPQSDPHPQYSGERGSHLVRSTYAELSVQIVTKYGAASSILIYFGEHRMRAL